eukprot:TRINITY_DN3564_c0_g1_i1.p1 TRINITY_DN3564_c0_g1~~TRINITY_DN3564_c0_g1_i1.p1  ORF type:complete len:123 (+),score=24.60 TRINITY_DN3564_c0_g1_i1:3-371(+)
MPFSAPVTPKSEDVTVWLYNNIPRILEENYLLVWLLIVIVCALVYVYLKVDVGKYFRPTPTYNAFQIDDEDVRATRFRQQQEVREQAAIAVERKKQKEEEARKKIETELNLNKRKGEMLGRS